MVERTTINVHTNDRRVFLESEGEFLIKLGNNHVRDILDYYTTVGKVVRPEVNEGWAEFVTPIKHEWNQTLKSGFPLEYVTTNDEYYLIGHAEVNPYGGFHVYNTETETVYRIVGETHQGSAFESDALLDVDGFDGHGYLLRNVETGYTAPLSAEKLNEYIGDDVLQYVLYVKD